MTNQQLMDNGHQMMDETDQAIERSKKVSIVYKAVLLCSLLVYTWLHALMHTHIHMVYKCIEYKVVI